MLTLFPGMDPYLERRGVWAEVHTGLLVALRHFLTPLLRPKYRVAVAQRVYLDRWPFNEQHSSKSALMGTLETSTVHQRMPGFVALAGPVEADPPLLGELPMPEEIKERYLEVRDTKTQEVITAIEILSPTNKESKDGRQQYERKRRKVLASSTSLVEIDLLRGGKPFAMKVVGQNNVKASDYRIVISRSWQRPSADLYLFSVRQPIPSFLIPLRPGEQEPVLPLNRILHELYDQGGYDLAIDYTDPADPPLATEDAQWATQLLAQ